MEETLSARILRLHLEHPPDSGEQLLAARGLRGDLTREPAGVEPLAPPEEAARGGIAPQPVRKHPEVTGYEIHALVGVLEPRGPDVLGHHETAAWRETGGDPAEELAEARHAVQHVLRDDRVPGPGRQLAPLGIEHRIGDRREPHAVRLLARAGDL